MHLIYLKKYLGYLSYSKKLKKEKKPKPIIKKLRGLSMLFILSAIFFLNKNLNLLIKIFFKKFLKKIKNKKVPIKYVKFFIGTPINSNWINFSKYVIS